MCQLDLKVKQIQRVGDDGPTVAIATVELDGQWMIHGVRVVQTGDKLFVALPQRKTQKDGNDVYYDVVHPLRREIRESLDAAVLQAYRGMAAGA